MQRFFSSTTMPATDWCTPLCSHEPASTYLVGRAWSTRSARGSGARTDCGQAPEYRTAADATGDYGECLRDFAYWIGGHGTISVGAEHAAVPRLWPQRPGTRRTVVHDDTAISRHDFVRIVPAVWAGQRGVHVSHSTCSTTSSCIFLRESARTPRPTTRSGVDGIVSEHIDRSGSRQRTLLGRA